MTTIFKGLQDQTWYIKKIFLDSVLGKESSSSFAKEPIAVFSSEPRKHNQSLQIFGLPQMCRVKDKIYNKLWSQKKIRIHCALAFPRVAWCYPSWHPATTPEKCKSPVGPLLYLPVLQGSLGYLWVSQVVLQVFI